METTASESLLRPEIQYIEHAGGIFDTLLNPSQDVEQELLGTMREQGVDLPLDDWKVRKASKWETLEDRLALPAHGDYYHMTQANFRQAVSLIPITPGMRVLEVGANLNLPFLRHFHERGAKCYAVNIYFEFRDPAEESWAVRTVADMNALPFRDESFDVVLLSATTHHSPDLDRTISEIHRVAKSGAYVLILNDQIHGVLKHFWQASRFEAQHRDEHVHENEYSLFRYRRLFKHYGLRTVATPFPAHYENRLSREDCADVRFSPLARLAGRAWKKTALRRMFVRLLPIGQILLGLQLNVVLQKS